MQTSEDLRWEILHAEEIDNGVAVHIRASAAQSALSLSPRDFGLGFDGGTVSTATALSVGVDFSRHHLDLFFPAQSATGSQILEIYYRGTPISSFYMRIKHGAT